MGRARKHTADALDVPKLLPVSVAILDRSGTIVGVNEGWKDFGRRSDLRTANFGVGANYLNYCGSDRANSVQLSRDLRALLEGKLNLLTRIYRAILRLSDAGSLCLVCR